MEVVHPKTHLEWWSVHTQTANVGGERYDIACARFLQYLPADLRGNLQAFWCRWSVKKTMKVASTARMGWSLLSMVYYGSFSVYRQRAFIPHALMPNIAYCIGCSSEDASGRRISVRQPRNKVRLPDKRDKVRRFFATRFK